MSRSLRVAVIGDFDPAFAPHRFTNEGISHAALRLGVSADVVWLPTQPLEQDLGDVKRADVIWCAPGSPYKSLRGAVAGLRYARENNVPTLGTCGGCQHIIIEYARNVLGFMDAQHAEYDPYASTLFVSELACSTAGQTMPVTLDSGSRAAQIYGRTQVEEQYYCNFGLNPKFQKVLDEGGLRITGFDEGGEARVLELPAHPFYMATLFVPQARSTAERPHPLILGLLAVAIGAAAPN